MTVDVECPECGRQYKVKDELAGRKIRCKSCSAVMEVPEADEWGFPEAPPELPARPTKPKKAAKKKSPQRRASSGMSSTMKWVLGFLGGGLICVFLCCGGVVWFTRQIGHQLVGEVAVPAGQTFDQWRTGFQTKLLRREPAPQGFQPETPPANVTEVLYPSDGMDLKAWVYRPPGVEEPRPALVYFHGGFAFSTEDLMESCAPFIEAGFVVMAPMLRGENGNPGNFELFFGEVDDGRAAVQWLAEQPYVDPQRIYAFGHSVGGGVAAILALLNDVPMRHSGSSGGLYEHLTFLEWQGLGWVPFENTPEERSVRLLVGNVQHLQHPHYAYVGSADLAVTDTVERLKKDAGPDGKLTIETVTGDHYTSLEPSLRQYLAVVQKDGQ